MLRGKKATLKDNSFNRINKKNQLPVFRNTHPLLNCLKGGLTTAPFPTTEYLPVRTPAKSPLIMAPLCTITFPCKMMFCEPHNTV